MSLEVVLLGTGTSVPAPHRRPPALLLKCEGISVLFDCGSGTSTALAEARVTLADLAGVFLTHLHLDHTADLAAMLFALRNPAGPSRRTDLVVRGPAGTRSMLAALRRAHGRSVVPRRIAVRGVELASRRKLRVGPLRVEPFAVVHSGSSFAYRVTAAGKTVCVSGDTGPCAGILAAARRADLLVCECAALEEEALPGHLSADAVGRLAAAARCRAVVLTHLYPWIAASDPLARVRRHFAGRVLLGADGMRFVARR